MTALMGQHNIIQAGQGQGLPVLDPGQCPCVPGTQAPFDSVLAGCTPVRLLHAVTSVGVLHWRGSSCTWRCAFSFVWQYPLHVRLCQCLEALLCVRLYLCGSGFCEILLRPHLIAACAFLLCRTLLRLQIAEW